MNYSYGTSGGIDDALSRIASLIDNDGVTHLADYTRIGRDTFVMQNSPQPQIAWSLINGTGIDPYSWLDQFNRIVDNRWYSTASNDDLDRIQHGYDLAGNRLWRRNTVAAASGVYLDELYAYDGLYRLAEMQRGELDSSNSGLVSGTLNFAQAWGLDATGNWGQFWEDDSGSSWNLQQTRTASEANEITAINGGGWAQPTYDAAGNMIQMPDGNTATTADEATFDAWNRLMCVGNGGSLVQQNAYDGEKRRVTALVSGTTRNFYYSLQWQDIEERLTTSATVDRQFVWGQRYVDDLVFRDCADFTPSRLYAFQDPNWNVAAIVGSSGNLSERYAYAPYGGPVFMSPAFSVLPSSAYNWGTLFAGYHYETAVGALAARERWDHPLLGNWLQRDPIAVWAATFSATYAGWRRDDGVNPTPGAPTAVRGANCWAEPYYAADRNLYRYVGGRPTMFTDPMGQDCPGCDLPDWLTTGGDAAHTKCDLQCCAQHDKCYHDNKCSSVSWCWNAGCTAAGGILGGLGGAELGWLLGGAVTKCSSCNQDIVNCVAVCAVMPDHMGNAPEYFCAKWGISIGIGPPPNNFPDLKAANTACCT